MFYFWGIILDLDKQTLPWQMCFIWGVVLDYGCLAIRHRHKAMCLVNKYTFQEVA